MISLISPATHTGSNDDVQSDRAHAERVPQIVSTVLTASVQNEVVQVRSISRIHNIYWHVTTDYCQRHLTVESVKFPKLR